MARRSIFVAIAALAAALVPAAAQAATPSVDERDLREPGHALVDADAVADRRRCSERPAPARRRPWRPDRRLDHHRRPRIRRARSRTRRATGRSVTTSRTTPSGSATRPRRSVDTRRSDGDDRRRRRSGAPNFLRGTVDDHVDERRRRSRASPRACCTPGPSAPARPGRGSPPPGTRPASPTAPMTSATSSTDVATHTATATVTVVVDNTVPTRRRRRLPRRERSWRGATVGLSTDAVDATAGIRNVQWRWAGGARRAAQHRRSRRRRDRRLGARLEHVDRRGGQRPPDGAVTISALVTDNAGNVLTIATPAVVDNTAPDVKAVVTAPPAVAGSPTLSWTPAHDAVGITRYDVLRGGERDRHRGQHRRRADVLLQRQERARSGDVDLRRARVRRRRPLRRLQRRVRARRLHGRERAAKGLTARDADVRGARAQLAGAGRVRRQSLRRLPRRAARRLDARARRATFTDATATEGTHDYAVLARDAASQPGVLSSSFKVVFDKTAPTSGGAPTAQVLASGQVNLAWPAAGDALSGVAGYVVRRTSGGTRAGRRRRRQRGLRAGRSPAASTPSAATGHLVVRRLRPRRRRQRRADRHGLERRRRRQDAAARTDEADGHAPEGQDEGRRASRSRCTGSSRRQPTSTASSSCSTSSARRSGRPTARPSTTASARSAKVKLLAGQTGYFALYAYDHSGNFSPTPLRKIVTLAVADLAAAAVGQPRARRPRRCSPGRPRRAAPTTTCRSSATASACSSAGPARPPTASRRASSSRARTSGTCGRPSSTRAARRPFGKLIGRATFTYKK